MPIVPTLRWAPLIRRSDLAQPAGFVSDLPRGAGDGYQLNVPRFLGSNTMGVTRASFPKSASEWGLVAPVDASMSHDFVPQLSFGNYAPVTGPYDNTTAWQIEPTNAFGHNCDIDVKWSLGDASQDRYDYASYKRSMACVIKAATEEDVGKIVRVNAVDKNDVPGGLGWWSGPYDIEHVDVELTLQWQPVVITFQNQKQFDGITPTLVISMPSADAPLCRYIAAAYTSANWHAHETDDASNWLRPLPFHESLGLLSQFQHRNSWGPDSDDPILYGGAAKASSSMNAPDDARFYGGRTMYLYTVPTEGGYTTDVPYRCEHLGDVYPSNEATGAVWLNVYVRPQSAMPSDGDLVGYVTARGTVVADNFTRDDSSTRMGNASTGQVWDEITGTWGISRNQGYLVSETGLAVIDSAVADAAVEVKWVSPQLGIDRPRLIFRLTDGNNYLLLDPETTTSLSLYKNVAGGFTPLASTSHAWRSGDVIKVIFSGNTINVYINEVLAIGPISEAFNSSATSHGIGVIINGSSLRFEGFAVNELTSYGPVSLIRDSASILQQTDGSSFYRCRIPVNLSGEGHLDFTPRIQNASGGTLTFYATRCAMIAESPRSAGWHNAWVPTRTISGPALSEAAWTSIGALANLLSNHEGIWLARFVPAFALGAVHDLNGNGGVANDNALGPGLWQSGPFGTADYSFDCGFEPTPDGVRFGIGMRRGAPAGGSWTNWFASITWSTDDPTRLPAFQAFDVAVAWRNDRLVAFGLGEGKGTRISWLENGDTYEGGLVEIGYEVGRTWDLADADSHIGLGADRDRIRQFGGWIQAIVASESVEPDAVTVKAWIEAIISYPGGWGPRLDYR